MRMNAHFVAGLARANADMLQELSRAIASADKADDPAVMRFTGQLCELELAAARSILVIAYAAGVQETFRHELAKQVDRHHIEELIADVHREAREAEKDD